MIHELAELDNFLLKIKSLEQDFSDALASTTKAIFNKFPEIACIYWKQYTPSFNDGNPCTLTVGDVHFIPKSMCWQALVSMGYSVDAAHCTLFFTEEDFENFGETYVENFRDPKTLPPVGYKCDDFAQLVSDCELTYIEEMWLQLPEEMQAIERKLSDEIFENSAVISMLGNKFGKYGTHVFIFFDGTVVTEEYDCGY
jgi:hypothetical protein